MSSLDRVKAAFEGIEYDVIENPTPAQLDDLFDFYRLTVQNHAWGRQYLNRAFFEEIGATWGSRSCGPGSS